MADETVSYYPPDLPLQITNVVTGAHTLDAKRLGRKPKVVARELLKLGDDPTPHGKRPDNLTDEQLAASLWAKLEADAEKFCKGHARYTITAHYSKPKQGPAPEPESFEIEVGSPPLAGDEEREREGFTGELRQSLRDQHKFYLELLRESIQMAKAVGTMATGLAGAWNSVHERQLTSKEHALELKILDNEREGERERVALLSKLVMPTLRLLQGKAQLALGPGDEDKPEIVRVARKLAATFTEEQWASAAEKLGSDRLRGLASVETEPEVLAIGAWLFANSGTEAVYNELRDEQVPLVGRLQELAHEAGERHAKAS